MLPLEGIKILDMSRLAPGPYCTMILGDLGADVLKIEQPTAIARGGIGGFPPPSPEAQRRNAYNAHDRNKRSMTLNLRTEEGQQVFYRLAQDADVVLEGFRPGVVKRLGVDYETIRGINPRIVYCSLSGYGQDGPYEGLVGHDINYIGIGGALGITGEAGRRPAIPMNIIGDFAAGGMHAAIGILTALMVRQKTGRGQYVDISMTDGVVSLLAAVASGYFSTGIVPRAGETLLNGGVAFYNVYETKDGKYISIGCLEPHFYENLCRALGREDFVPHQNSPQKREEIFAHFRQTFLTKTRDEWFELLKQTDICVGPVYGMDEVFSDPQVLQRNMVVEVEHPNFGKVKQVGISVKLSETPGAIRSLAPTLGQHTEEVLLSLGYAKEKIEELRAGGAI